MKGEIFQKGGNKNKKHYSELGKFKLKSEYMKNFNFVTIGYKYQDKILDKYCDKDPTA